jgi:hypothetical protein
MDDALVILGVVIIGVALMIDVWRQALQWYDSKDE